MKIESVLVYLKHPFRLLVRVGAESFMKMIPDSVFIKIQFKDKLGYVPNLKNPTSFNEKVQWIKLNCRKNLYTELVDKYEVRKHIKNVLGENYLIPLLGGPWDSFDNINWDKLPERFVLKCTHDSGGLVICRDKLKLDKKKAKKKITKSLKRNFYWQGREWPYKKMRPRIICESYMTDENNIQKGGLTDYKFFCFNGEPKMVYVSLGLEEHSTASISFYDMNGKRLPFERDDYKPVSDDFCMPDNFDEMGKVAKKLATYVECPFVRIDLYSINGHIYFSEITFSPCSGMIPFSPIEWDYKLGKWIELKG